MATESKITLFKEKIEEFQSLDKSHLYRDKLGEESLSGDLKNLLEENVLFYTEHVAFTDYIPDSTLQRIIKSLDALKLEINRMENISNSDFIRTRQNIINAINSQMDVLLSLRSAFITEKIKSTGLLDDSGSLKKLNKNESAVKSRIEQLDEKFKEVDRREAKIRQTAAGISVEEAQKQFSEAAEEQQTKINYWEKISAGSIVLFVGFALILWYTKPIAVTIYDSIYFTTIRITILITIGAFTAFSLKILRAHMHMKELNKHRERLSNSLPAFVEAVSENQRDIIITNLVDAISSFGKSGLLQKEDDSMSIPKIVIDTISKTLPGNN